jgi:hypothetical protein
VTAVGFGQVAFDIFDETPDLFPAVMAHDFIVCVLEEALDGMDSWVASRQKDTV